MKCPKCNAEVAESTKFCPECGEKMTVTANQAPASESEPPVTPTPLVPDQKSKKKKTKKIIIISAGSVLLCGILFLVLYLLNPLCMFGHNHTTVKVTKEATCTMGQEKISVCDDCGTLIESWVIPSSATIEYGGPIGHDFGTIVCGTELSCVHCGEKTLFQHESKYSDDDCCMHCGKSKISIKLPPPPVTVHVYDSRGNIEQSCTVTQINAETSGVVSINYTVKRTYHENGNNYSARAEFVWKLYASDGSVVCSGTASSNGSIAVGEQSNGSITLFDFMLEGLENWTECTLEILSIS